MRRRFAGVEPGSRVSQIILNRRGEWVRATKHAPRDPCNVFELCHGLAEIDETGGGVAVERLRVKRSHHVRELSTLAENASRRGYRFAQQRFDFCVAS